MTALEPVAPIDTTSPPPPPTWVADLRTVLVAASEHAANLHADGDLESLIAGLANFRTLVKDMRIVEQTIEDYAADLIAPKAKIAVAGIGVAEARRSSTKRWDRDEVLTRLLRPLFVDTETGELLDPVLDDVRTVLEECLPASVAWRVGTGKSAGVRDHGIDPADEDVCSTVWGRRTVSIL